MTTKHFLSTISLSAIAVLCLFLAGCDDSSSTPVSSKTNLSGLFKTEGTFSLTSNRGNFLATGIFDTLYTNTSASGAFKYTEDGNTVVMIFAYNVISQTNFQMVFAGFIDTLNTTAAGTYSFNPVGSSKIALFGYFPNMLDTSDASGFYFLNSGSMNVSTLTATSVAGTFSGGGKDVVDTNRTITISNGTFNTPVVEHYFATPDYEDELVIGKIKETVRNEMRKRMQD